MERNVVAEVDVNSIEGSTTKVLMAILSFDISGKTFEKFFELRLEVTEGTDLGPSD